MPQDVITLVILAVTVVMIVSLITDCVKDGHRTEERILIRKESMLRRRLKLRKRRELKSYHFRMKQARRKVPMITKRAIEIARDIHNDETEVEDKLTAIQDIVELDKVPKSVRKEDLVEMLRWLIEEYI